MVNKIKYILGIQCFANYESGACILKIDEKKKDYDYVAISEERLIRKKYNYLFPTHSINYCMEYFNLKKLSQIDFLVSDIIRVKRWLRSGPAYNVTEFDYLMKKLKISSNKIIQINHHLAHAASVFYTSGFKDSSILIVDGNGTDLETNSFYYGKGTKIKKIDTYKARGIGQVYSTFTKDVLNLGLGGEGKVMGLAPYGKHKGKKIIDFSKVKYDNCQTDYSSILKRQPYTDIFSLDYNFKNKKFNKQFRKRGKKDDITKGLWPKIAFEIQEEAEKNLIKLGKSLQKKTNSKNLCVSGGVALNSVANKKMFDKTHFKNVSIFPGCSDAGIPMGLALWGAYNISKLKKPRLKSLKNAYTGKRYIIPEIEKILKKFNIRYNYISNKETAKLIAEGKVIGWFQGASEYGPRALGNRSILADARSNKMRDYINLNVKHRELYRPFAPSVLEEDASSLFDLKIPSPYMLLVAKVKSKKIPAISHIDDTARVQTVNKKQNAKFYDLIKNYKKITGIGCILNTSFNDAGEPIVETPLDALITFFSTSLDHLIIENLVLHKSRLNSENTKKAERMKKLRSSQIKQSFEKNKKILFGNINKKQQNKYIKSTRSKAKWQCALQPIEDLKNKIFEIKRKNLNVILIGTFDHTQQILENFKDFTNLNVEGFIPYKNKNENYLDKKQKNLPFKILNSKKLDEKNKNFKRIYLISSFEFSYDIEKLLNSKNIKNYYKIYNSYSRDINFHKKFSKW